MLTEDFSNESMSHLYTTQQILIPYGREDVQSLEEYKLFDGLKGLAKARSLTSPVLIRLIKNSDLRGRGGAGFPVGVKLDTVNNAECKTRYVVCNAAEGEPGTYKDRYLIRKNPYQLIEGILIACHAVKATRAVIGIKKKFTHQIERLRYVITEMEQDGIMDEGAIEIFEGPDEYLFGEEKALCEAIDGRGALPRIMPPYMLGIREKPHAPNPAAVNNAETLSHLPHILRNGPDWFKRIGSPGNGGTMIFTLSGDVKRPGMYELPMGTTLRTLLYEFGGGPARQHEIKAVFSGVANAAITPDLFDTPMDFDSMKRAGTGLGSGGFMVYDDSACMVKAAMTFAKFLANGSCGQCIPCGQGTGNLYQWLAKVENGNGTLADIDNILFEPGRMTNQTRCYLPVQASILISSILKKFPDEFRRHCGHSCPKSRLLALPKIEFFDEFHSEFYIDE